MTRLKSLLADSVADGLVEQSIGVMPYADRETNPTFALGLAGGLAAMRAVHAETGLGSASRLAAHYAEALSGAKVPGRGFATGSAGIAWALGRTAVRATDEADIAALSGNDHGWCSGLTGALLAYAEVTGGDDLPEHAVTSLAERAPLKDLSLCHGESGIIEGLCVLAGSGHTGAASAVRLRTGRLLAALDRHGARCGTPSAVPAPGLLTGLAGIGYGLLRLGFTTQVPSALLMQQGPGADTELRG